MMDIVCDLPELQWETRLRGKSVLSFGTAGPSQGGMVAKEKGDRGIADRSVVIRWKLKYKSAHVPNILR